MQATVKGECRCGRVTFEVSSQPLMTMACHCTGCQKMTASAFSLSSLYADSAFKITSGEPVIGGIRGGTRHFFCDYCKSWLFTRPEGMDDFVNVRATLLDDAQNFVPFIETWTSEKLHWALTGAAFSYRQFPPREELPQLGEAFQAFWARHCGA